MAGNRGGRAARRRVGAVVALAVLVFGACTSGDGDEVSSGDTDEVAGTTTTEETGSTTIGPPQPTAGCGAADVAAGIEVERTLEVDGMARRYLLTTPTGHDGETPVPLVLDFHGLLEGAEIHSGMSRYSDVAEEEDFVVVFPHGTGDPLAWNVNPTADPNPDLQYFDAVVAQLSDELCLDASRIYATGLSNGAMFTSLLLCERADVLAAAAPVAGLTELDGCDPSRAVPIVAFHGTDDPILLFNGGVDTSSFDGSGGDDGATTTTGPEADLDGEGYPANVAAFASRNGCDPQPTDTELTAEVVHRVYDCPDGADVEFYIVMGGGHSWPSSEFSASIGDVVGTTTFDIDATRDAWAFLSRFANT